MTKINEDKMKAFMDRAILDFGAAASVPMVIIGDQLGLYKAMAGAGPLTVRELAERTGTTQRYLQEWLANQAAGGYLEFQAESGKYYLPPEQAMALADESSPFFIAGGFQVIAAMFQAEPKIGKNFKTGAGLDWGEHDDRLFHGTERFFRANYIRHLLKEWIPALEGVENKLIRGAKVADVGCGLGASVLLMAQAFPNSKFYGFDFHEPSIAAAKKRAQKAGLENSVTFEVANAIEFPGEGYDLVANFDCLHDMGDPVGVGKKIHRSLAADGTWMIVEPFAEDKLEQNLNPVGRLFYAASTCVCVPASLAQDGMALGAQAGQARLEKVVRLAGFNHFRRATQTPFNLVLEAKA